MFAIGGAIGALSLRLNSSTLTELKRMQDVSDALGRAVVSYKDALSELGWLDNAYYGELGRNTGETSQETRRLNSQAAELLREAKNNLEDARAAFESYKRLPKPAGSHSVLTEVEESFGILMNYGLYPLITALERGDIPAHQIRLEMVQDAQDGRFARAVDHFHDWRADKVVASYDIAEKRYEWVLLVMIIGGVIAVLLVFATYIFLRRQVLQPLKEAGQYFDLIANGDLTAKVGVRSTNEIGQLFTALKRMQESLTRTVAAVRRGVEEINVGSREIATGNANLSNRTEQQAATLEETAASMQELAFTVKQNAENASQANQLAASASDVAARGGAAVSEVVRTMHEISLSSHKISEIVSVIDGIAFRTSILALNAAVEAARAGEQGKGFAVVAGEVRSLAQRCANAAKEIKVLIEESVNKVSAGSQQVERAGATMQDIVTSVRRVTDIMSEIAAASEEQSKGIDQVNGAVLQMDGVTQQNAVLVEEAAAAASSLQEQAQWLADAVAVLKINAGEVIDVQAQRLAQSAAQANGGQLLAPMARASKH
jgi:methyl-accepting chemotaxis protein-1 (serine sensor receptor)